MFDDGGGGGGDGRGLLTLLLLATGGMTRADVRREVILGSGDEGEE
jgi:hypothetical protein